MSNKNANLESVSRYSTLTTSSQLNSSTIVLDHENSILFPEYHCTQLDENKDEELADPLKFSVSFLC